MLPVIKPKVAILFGEWLVRGQIETFLRLKDEFDITLFVWSTNEIPLDEIELNCITLRGLESFTGPRKFPLSRLMLRVLHKKFGSSYVPGLPKKLKDFDVIYSAEPYGAWTEQAIQAKKLNPALKVIVQSFENLPFRRHTGATLRAKNLAFAGADKFVAMSLQAKDVLISEGARPDLVEVIPLSVDTNKFCAGAMQDDIRQRFKCGPDETAIVFIGRLLWEKGILDLAAAHAKIREIDPVLFNKSKLVFIGDGTDRVLLENHIKLYKLSDNVVMLTRIAHERLPNFYRAADIFVTPSLFSKLWEEQFGAVFLEAMACEIPIISTRTGAIPEVVQDCAKLVQPHDIDQLASAILELAKSTPLREQMVKAGRKLVCESYDSAIVQNKLAAIIRSVVTQKDAVPTAK